MFLFLFFFLFLLAGKPKPWHLLTFLESARYYSQHWPLEISGRVFRDYAQLTDDRLTFMVSTRLDIETTMYDAKIPKAPLDVVVQGGFIGNCSLNTITTVVTKSSKKLMRNITQVVSIDKTSRRPLPLPDWWKNKYAESAKPHKPLKFSTIEKPKNVPFINYRVVRSDLDSNNHANWSVYVKYSLDAMYHFSKTGYLASFSDFDSFSLSRMDLMYSGESFDDNELQVNAWEENECNHNTVISLILKDNQLLFQGKFKFLKDSQL